MRSPTKAVGFCIGDASRVLHRWFGQVLEFAACYGRGPGKARWLLDAALILVTTQSPRRFRSTFPIPSFRHRLNNPVKSRKRSRCRVASRNFVTGCLMSDVTGKPRRRASAAVSARDLARSSRRDTHKAPGRSLPYPIQLIRTAGTRSNRMRAFRCAARGASTYGMRRTGFKSMPFFRTALPPSGGHAQQCMNIGSPPRRMQQPAGCSRSRRTHKSFLILNALALHLMPNSWWAAHLASCA